MSALRRTTGLVGAAALGALLALQARPEPAAAQSRPQTVWEYRVFRLSPDEYADKADYREVLAREQNDPLKADSAFQQRVLEHLGREGWELVAVERPRQALVHLYLKRPVR